MKRINRQAMQRENDDRWPVDHPDRPADQPRNPAWPGDAPGQNVQASDANHDAARSSPDFDYFAFYPCGYLY